MGSGAALAFLGPTLAGGILSSCASLKHKGVRARGLPFEPIEPSFSDDLILARGFKYNVLAKWDDPLNARGDRFGTHCDFTAFIPLDPAHPDDGLLWVNHEYHDILFASGYHYDPKSKAPRKREDVLKEMKTVGGSIIRVRKDPGTGAWSLVYDDPHNRRIDAATPISLVTPRPIRGSNTALGTFGNCGGGVTPWGTILTCEENYHEYIGERDYAGGRPGGILTEGCFYGWETVLDYPPEHYGWVVEVNPRTGAAKKLTSLGRFGHESATVRRAHDGRCVVYSGDDSVDRCLYKFIADRPGTLEHGTLYVADTHHGRWIPLGLKKNPALRAFFEDDLDVLLRARLAALYAGGTPLDRPEDIDVDPKTGAVFVSLTNNPARGNHFGSILKIEERGGDPLSLEFKASTFLAGGPESGFACPDNLAFDRSGNLWMVTDISTYKAGQEPYASFKNNGLFYIPMSGPHAGRALQVGSAPVGAEFTGLSFTPDGSTLFMSVQHPGEDSVALDNPKSRWPGGGAAGKAGARDIPRSSVVAIQGDLLNRVSG